MDANVSAYEQWQNRPSDERYWSVREMHDVMQRRTNSSYVKSVALDDIKVASRSEGGRFLSVEIPGFYRDFSNDKLVFSNFAFGQLCGLVGAPAGYLRTLPVDLVSECLNSSIQRRKEENRDLMCLIEKNTNTVFNTFTLRAVTSEKYSRIWNSDVSEVLLPIEEKGWRPPPCRARHADDPRNRTAMPKDIFGGTKIKIGDKIGPGGIYAGDRDMFCLLVDPDRRIEFKGNMYYRGIIVENSEVGTRSFRMSFFLYSAVCGNHILYGHHELMSVRVIHKGTATAKAVNAFAAVKQLQALPESFDIARMSKACNTVFGKDEESFKETIYKTRKFTQPEIDKCIEMVRQHPEDRCGSSPYSVWSAVQGFTRSSQQYSFMADRVDLDKRASSLIEEV